MPKPTSKFLSENAPARNTRSAGKLPTRAPAQLSKPSKSSKSSKAAARPTPLPVKKNAPLTKKRKVWELASSDGELSNMPSSRPSSPELTEVEPADSQMVEEGMTDGADGSVQASDTEDDIEVEDIPVPLARIVPKKNMASDLRLIFSEELQARFTIAGQVVQWKGRWCNLCKADKKLIESSGLQATFRRGGNSTCRYHIRSFHYDEYHRLCQLRNIPENPQCMPERPGDVQLATQSTLDAHVVRIQEFSRENLVHRLAQHIVLTNQALSAADGVSLHNCWVACRPRTTTKDIPTTHDVVTHIKNSFVDLIESLFRSITDSPSQISTTLDSWTADSSKESFLGTTAHWISIRDGRWKLESAVIGFKGIAGAHTGETLATCFTHVLRRVGVIQANGSKLEVITADSASNNGVLCRSVQSYLDRHASRSLQPPGQWLASENQLSCLEHVLNLGNVAFMSAVAKVAAVENTTAMWEYDPTLPDNRVLGGSLDAIAVLRTLALKIQASSQRIQYFNKLQAQTGVKTPLRILLHSNVRWGTAKRMLDRGIVLKEAIRLFITTADQLFGPITTLRRNGKVHKHIPWTAFLLSKEDWDMIQAALDILVDSNKLQHTFSADKRPCLWQAIPAIEELLTVWESKRSHPRYKKFVDALDDAIQKIRKYYVRFDEKPWITLAIVLHPYFKLLYIAMAWGGEKEQQEAIANGDPDAKNWVAEATRLIESKMEEYWPKRLHQRPSSPAASSHSVSVDDDEDSLATEFDRHRRELLQQNRDGGWQSELRRYLDDTNDVGKDIDLIQWWQDNSRTFPTLARIALDVLPIQASSVACERLFSSAKLVATHLRARLGAEQFERIQMLKWCWRNELPDLAAMNDTHIEDCTLEDAMLGDAATFLEIDQMASEWDDPSVEPVFSRGI